MKITALLTVSFLAFVGWAGNRVSYAGDARNVNSVNGSVTARSGETYDTLSAVNGDVSVERGATAQTIRTVNGEVAIETATKVGSASTVNGEIDIAANATVTGDASTVNGGVKIGKRTQVGGNVSTVSGEIELAGAEVGGTVSTVNGEIDLTDGAHIRGGILVRENKSTWNKEHQDPVKVHICSTCVVDGDLRFERPVELRVDSGAKIGKVIGDQVTRL